MALGLKTESNSGDFLARIQFDARAGRFFKVDRIQVNGNWEPDINEIALPTQFAFDFDGIEVGWMMFGKGAPDFKLVPLGQPLPPQPTPDHKQGFRLKVYNKQIGVRHWNHTAKCVLAAVDQLHNQWERERSDHRGEVPIVTIARTVAITSGSGDRKSTNYAPVFEIDRWIDRPAGFDEPVKAEPVAGATARGSTAEQHAQRPEAKGANGNGGKPNGAQHIEAPMRMTPNTPPAAAAADPSGPLF